MRKRSSLIGALGALAMIVAGNSAAAANFEWCAEDPPIQVVTPGGHFVTVNNTVYLATADPRLRNQVTDSAAAAPDGVGGTLIAVYVNVPGGVSQALVVSSVYHYQVSKQADGSGGTVITLFLDVPVS